MERYSDSITKIKLKEVLDYKAIQSLMDDFYALTNVGIGILDMEGEVLVATGWQDICMLFHRANQYTLKNCIESDTYLFNNISRGECLEYECRNHLRDIATPIYINDQHVGNIFLGQFFYEDELPEVSIFENQADQYGFNKDEYISALLRVPRWNRDRVNTVLSFYSKFARLISQLLENNLRLKALNAENKRAIRSLKQSNEELEQYAYIASHDLQEPLRMVSSFTHLLGQRYRGKLDPRADEYIGHIQDGTRRMHGLISDILAFSGITKPNSFLTVDLNKVVGELLEDLKLLICESNAVIKVDKLPAVNADPAQMKMLFQNLIQNAVKFRSGKPPEISISALETDKEWIISIKDNGIGIAPEYGNKIFAMFQRLHEKEKYPGTGIGLALCKKIMDHHGGRIWVESRPSEGSTFFIALPDK